MKKVNYVLDYQETINFLFFWQLRDLEYLSNEYKDYDNGDKTLNKKNFHAFYEENKFKFIIFFLKYFCLSKKTIKFGGIYILEALELMKNFEKKENYSISLLLTSCFLNFFGCELLTKFLPMERRIKENLYFMDGLLTQNSSFFYEKIVWPKKFLALLRKFLLSNSCRNYLTDVDSIVVSNKKICELSCEKISSELLIKHIEELII